MRWMTSCVRNELAVGLVKNVRLFPQKRYRAEWTGDDFCRTEHALAVSFAKLQYRSSIIRMRWMTFCVRNELSAATRRKCSKTIHF